MKLRRYSFRLSACITFIALILLYTDLPLLKASAQNGENTYPDSFQVLSINLLFSEIDDRNKRLKRIADYVAENDVDVVLLQEVVKGDLVNTDNSALDLRDFIFERHNLNYFTATETVNILSNLLKVGNAILSRHQIVYTDDKKLPDASEIEIFGIFDLEIKRNVMMIRLNVSGFGAIHIYNTHLCANCEIEEREDQLDAVLQFVNDVETNISGENPVVVGGDFNIDKFKKNGLENFLYDMVLLGGFSDAYAAGVGDPLDELCEDESLPDEHCTIGVSDLGDSNPGRIDYIFSKGFGGVIESKVVFNTAISGDPTVSDHSAVFVSLDLSSQETNMPVPDIKVNGSDDPVTVTTDTPISITVSLDPGDYDGQSSDWWVAADSPFGWYYFDNAISKDWLPGQEVTHQGPLFNLSAYEVLNRMLPEGTYRFYFGVDLNPNGIIDSSSLYYDSVSVTVTP